jgi:menaquinone-9 beta-reductase
MPEIMKPFDVVVIGGGLAGSAAATRLAQEGCKALLLEKETAAHDKVCGEFISFEAQRYLAKLGFDLTALGAEPINRIRLMRGDKVAATQLPFLALSLSRRRLDDAMLSHAGASGVELRRGVTVAGLAQEGSRWHVELAGSDPVFAGTVFLATGKHDLRGWQRSGGSQNNFIGFKLHFELTPTQKERLADHIDMALFDGGYAGLEPVEDGKANLCLVVTKSRFAHYGKNWGKLLGALLRMTPPLAERLAGAKPCWPRPLSIFGIPYGFVYRDKPDAPPGLYRLGDQMAVIPSFSGDGMAIALHTAFRGVESHFHDDASSYHRRARAELLPQIRRAALLSKMVEFPLAQAFMVSMCSRAPKLMAGIATGTRLAGIPYVCDPVQNSRTG